MAKLRSVIVVMGIGLLLAAASHGSATAQPGELPPYIYYYSDLYHAFVIERADGSDSRLLAEGVMRDDHDDIRSVTWSPSGEWVAWLSRIHYLGSWDAPGPSRVWIMRTDGSERVTLLDDAFTVYSIQWSPSQDLLLVVYRTEEDGWAILQVIDVSYKQIVVDTALYGDSYFTRFNEDLPPETHGWMPDGSAIYYWLEQSASDLVVRLGLDGTQTSWVFDDSTHLPFDFQAGRLLYPIHPYILGGIDLVVEDFVTGRKPLITAAEWRDLEIRDYDLHWNPDRSFALVEEKQCEDEACEVVALSLMDWDTMTQVPLPASLTITPCSLSSYHRVCDSTRLWSPDGAFAALRDADDHMTLVEARTGQTYPLDLGSIEAWHWLNDGDVLLVTEDYGAFYRFDAESHALSFLGATRRHVDDVVPSPDGHHLGLVPRGDPTVRDTQRNDDLAWPPFSRMYFGMTEGYQWHDGGKWFFSGAHANSIERGIQSNGIMIHHISDPTRRELTLCYDVFTCVGFVPDRALPHLAPGQPESVTPAPPG